MLKTFLEHCPKISRLELTVRGISSSLISQLTKFSDRLTSLTLRNFCCYDLEISKELMRAIKDLSKLEKLELFIEGDAFYREHDFKIWVAEVETFPKLTLRKLAVSMNPNLMMLEISNNMCLV